MHLELDRLKNSFDQNLIGDHTDFIEAETLQIMVEQAPNFPPGNQLPQLDFSDPVRFFNQYPRTTQFINTYQEYTNYVSLPMTSAQFQSLNRFFVRKVISDLAEALIRSRGVPTNQVFLGSVDALDYWQLLYPKSPIVINPFGQASLLNISTPHGLTVDTTGDYPTIAEIVGIISNRRDTQSYLPAVLKSLSTSKQHSHRFLLKPVSDL